MALLSNNAIEKHFGHIYISGWTKDAKGNPIKPIFTRDTLARDIVTFLFLGFEHRCHRKILPVYQKINEDINSQKLEEFIDAEDTWRNGGIFNLRCMRKSGKISRHSWALPADIQPKFNIYGVKPPDKFNPEKPLVFTIDHPVVLLFQKYGFDWGGRWKNFDTHHLEPTQKTLEMFNIN